MTTITETTTSDLELIERWIQEDQFHRDDKTFTSEGLLTGQGVLTFCLRDDDGPICFARLDDENGMLRLATQFGPESEVTKKRLVTGLVSVGIPAIILFAKSMAYRGIVFESFNDSLIKFMGSQGFRSVGGLDYAIIFGENQHV